MLVESSAAALETGLRECRRLRSFHLGSSCGVSPEFAEFAEFAMIGKVLQKKGILSFDKNQMPAKFWRDIVSTLDAIVFVGAFHHGSERLPIIDQIQCRGRDWYTRVDIQKTQS